MSEPTQIKASGVPFVPELRKENNEVQMKALFRRFQELNDHQTRIFAAGLFGSCEAFVCYDFCPATTANIIDSIKRALTVAEANKL